MVLPEWEQIYSLSASTTCIPVQNFRWFARVPTSQWATTFALQGYLLLRFKCGPHCHTNLIRTNGVLGPCFGYFLFLTWFQHSYKTGGTSKNYPRFRFCCSSSIWVILSLGFTILFTILPNQVPGRSPLGSVNGICGGGWMSSISGGYRCFSWKTSQVFNS